MNFSFHPEAEAEFFAAIDFYEKRELALGKAFAIEVTSAILRILDFPNAWPLLDAEVRRCLINRFPFAVLYSVEQENVLILAIMHLNREPNYWKR